MSEHQISIWTETAPVPVLPANLVDPSKIAEFAVQLAPRDKNQLLQAYRSESYEMATTFLWAKSMAALKRELAALGLTFLAEILGRTDISEEDDIVQVISDRDAIRLAEELGVVTPTEGLRLRHSQELVAHFSQGETSEGEPMEMAEAVSVLGACVRGVLAKERIVVAMQFAEFRQQLEMTALDRESPRVTMLLGSPYFFRRLAISVLLSGVRVNTGAKLENCVSNLVLLLPLLWEELRDPERWQVGATYGQVYNDGLQRQAAGLRDALLKVKGFDYVPETLRSQSFKKAAEAIIRAHEGMNNFYTESAPTTVLENLGTVIPNPAVGDCFTALLCVYLGNRYGFSWAAASTALSMLKKQRSDRWNYYVNKVLPGDVRVLEKLASYERPRARWIELVKTLSPLEVQTTSREIKLFWDASEEGASGKVEAAATRLYNAYYSPPKAH